MQVYALDIKDLCEDEYSLIGIHSTLEDYKLAYLLNKTLDTRFCKSEKDLEFVKEKDKITYSLFNYENATYDLEYFLISNSFISKNQAISKNLLLNSETKIHLIPEKKKVDFFLKISGDLEYEFVMKTINKIKNIDYVITAYSIDKNTLKSKDFLIF
ncbi:IPExxxVDY family protein [Polaribacter sargassicola]|uniref:IPExxxVDY family protein n=1 Tax=Polaribacter sargassicola TaxID=2836891 RepID=UPI001F2C42E5|nr:IPExxxVDY family protein [Polaribacter sp. DS7-9]MCG1035154.1 IPExxxVDY family protein [Polaribacter sp. DS7-9]